MAKRDAAIDVLVLGENPAAYLAAALMGGKSRLGVLHATIPQEPADERLVLINPGLFTLHKLLQGMQAALDLRPVFGARFLADDPVFRSEHRSRLPMAWVGSLSGLREQMHTVAKTQGVELATPRSLHIHHVDDGGLEVSLDRTRIHPKVLLLAGRLPAAEEHVLGLPEAWEPQVVHRYSHVKLRNPEAVNEAGGLVPMSLDLQGTLCWGWLLMTGVSSPGEECNDAAQTPRPVAQLAVAQPIETLAQWPPEELLQHWAAVLQRHGLLSDATLALDVMESVDVPYAGALVQEAVANRTLLVGPAGGFISAAGEDVYPGCWSAVYAADAVKHAMRAPHLQDALQVYRSKWRTTLGSYLRGPQQDLRFLLPLVYRNQIMTQRLAESILLGKSVVR